MPESKVLHANSSRSLTRTAITILAGMALVVAAFISAFLLQSPAGQPVANFLNWMFAANSVQTMWYIIRAAGFTAYILLWLSVAWGLAVGSKAADKLLHRAYTYDFHQFISLLALAFTGLHIVVLLFDRYQPYSLAQILIPLLSPYRPLWVGVGIVAFYLCLLVTVTFYVRSRIGMKAFRTIHVFSLVAFLGAAVHGLFAGTDSSLPSVLILYAFTFGSTVLLMAYWLVQVGQRNRKKAAPATGGGCQPVGVQVKPAVVRVERQR